MTVPHLLYLSNPRKLIDAKVVAVDEEWGAWIELEKDGRKYRIYGTSIDGDGYLLIEEVTE